MSRHQGKATPTDRLSIPTPGRFADTVEFHLCCSPVTRGYRFHTYYYHIGLTALTYSHGAAPAGEGLPPLPSAFSQRAHGAPIIQVLCAGGGPRSPAPPCSLLPPSARVNLADLVARLGPAALLAKVDIESAYRLIPVHPDDRPLLAMKWENQLYIDPMLPFGLRSAPMIFNAVADALAWYLNQKGIPLLRHYLDDFIIVAPPCSAECQESLATLDRVCKALRVPIAEHKMDGPTSRLIYLGIEVDTEGPA